MLVFEITTYALAASTLLLLVIVIAMGFSMKKVGSLGINPVQPTFNNRFLIRTPPSVFSAKTDLRPTGGKQPR